MARKHTEEGARLRQWREERGLPRIQVAAALGVTERTVVRWELGQGRPRVGDWDRLRALWPAVAAVVAMLLALGCGGSDDGASSSGRFGEACYAAADCTGLKAQLNDSIKADDTIECAAAAGEPKCRFSCRTPSGKDVNPGAVEACAALGGECVSGVCLP